MFADLLEQLQRFPLTTPQPQPALRNAAVLVGLHGSAAQPQVILTERAAHLKSHPGEVAFPGGMFERGDSDLLATALRETWEEIGLVAEQIEPLATLPVATPKRSDVLVTPFVGRVAEPLQFTLEASEIGAVFSVPLAEFMAVERYRYFSIDVRGRPIEFPYLEYRGYRIWGFTLQVIIELLNDCLGAGIALRYPAEYQRDRSAQIRADLAG